MSKKSFVPKKKDKKDNFEPIPLYIEDYYIEPPVIEEEKKETVIIIDIF
jgi:hypothetical protein